VGQASFSSVELSDPRFERDGLRVVTVNSHALGRRADVCFWAPPIGAASAPLPLLILLHGAAGSAWSWPLRGGAHLTAGRLVDAEEISPLAIAMPSDGMWGGGSGYVNHADADYEPACAGLFPMDPCNPDRYLSTGRTNDEEQSWNSTPLRRSRSAALHSGSEFAGQRHPTPCCC